VIQREIEIYKPYETKALKLTAEISLKETNGEDCLTKFDTRVLYLQVRWHLGNYGCGGILVITENRLDLFVIAWCVRPHVSLRK
jgi:hypothetical protein